MPFKANTSKLESIVVDLGSWSETCGSNARYRKAKIVLDHKKAWALIGKAMDSASGKTTLGNGFVTITVEK